MNRNSKNPIQGKKQAVILVQNLPVPFDRRVWQEATSLSNAGWEVDVICPSNEKYPEGEYFLEGVQIHRFEAIKEARTPLGYLREYTQSLSRMRKILMRLGREKSVQVLHFCNPPDLLALLALEAKLSFKSKIIFDQHDLGPELVIAKSMPFSWFFVRVAQITERLAYGVADRVIATNESYKDIATSRGKKSSSEVTVVRSGPHKNWADNSQRDLKWRQGHRFQIGYLGVIGEQEGLHSAIEAVKILKEKHLKDVFFTVVGSGTDLEKIKAYAKQLDVEDNIQFMGRLPDDEMKLVLGSADVCVNPDVYSVLNNLSTMNKIIEYMALGVPIVQFDMKEGRFSAGEASLYATPDDPHSLAERIDWLLDHVEVREKMGEAGRQRFKNTLCWDTQEPFLLEAYNSVL